MKKIIILVGVLIILGLLGGGFYWYGKSHFAQKNRGELIPSISANPLENKPDVNPTNQANPFKNIKTNPFE